VTTTQYLHDPVGSLSGGSARRSRSRARRCGNPRVVILDEPTAALGARRIATFEQAHTTPQEVVSAIIGGIDDQTASAAACPYLAAG
jgi:energy-coupling factor transporter ATP-binding protein EcfA2